MTTLSEAQKLLKLDQNEQITVAVVDSWAANGQVYVKRRGQTSVEGPYSIAGPLGYELSQNVLNVLMVRIASGYLVVQPINQEIAPHLVISGSPYTAIPGRDRQILVDSASAFTVNLYPAMDNGGRIIYIKRVGTGSVTIVPAGGELIDGKTSISVGRYSNYELFAECQIPDLLGRWHII